MTGSHSDTVPSGGRFDGISGVLAGSRGRALPLRPRPSAAPRLRSSRLPRRRGERLRRLLHWLAGDDGAARRDPAGPDLSRWAHPRPGARNGGRQLPQGWRRRCATMSGRSSNCISNRARCWSARTPPSAWSRRSSASRGSRSSSRARRAMPARYRWMGAATPWPRPRRWSVGSTGRATEIAREAEGHFVATAGVLQVEPNAPNVVPARARLVIDARSDDEACVERFVHSLRAEAEADGRAPGRPIGRLRAALQKFAGDLRRSRAASHRAGRRWAGPLLDEHGERRWARYVVPRPDLPGRHGVRALPRRAQPPRRRVGRTGRSRRGRQGDARDDRD